MAKEEGDCCELLALSEQEKNAIVENDVPVLSSILEKQQAILADLKKLTVEKQSILSALGGEAGLPEGRLQVQDVNQSAPLPLRGEMQALAGEIEELGQKLHRISALNQTLIETQLQYTMFCMNTLTGRDGMPSTYSGSGRVQEGTAQRCLVDQAI